MKKTRLVERARKRRIWIKNVSWRPHFYASFVGRRHGGAGLAKDDGDGWTSPLVRRKLASYLAFENAEFAFCEELLSDLRVESEKVKSELLLLNKEESEIVEPNEASEANQMRAQKAFQAKKLSMFLQKQGQIARLAEIKEIINSVEIIILQRCDEAGRRVESHLLAYWTGVVQTHPDRCIPNAPKMALPVSSAREKYEERHAENNCGVEQIMQEFGENMAVQLAG